MNQAYQLDLFHTRTEFDDIRDDLKAVAESHDKVRRRIFKEHSDLCKLVIQLKEEMYDLRMSLIKRVK